MSRFVRHLFACLLLVLLPFQALAASFAVAAAPVVSCTEQMMDGMDCCDEESTSCPGAGDCVVHVVIALPVPASATCILPCSSAAIAPVPALHESYIPDRLQRPPQAFVS